MTNKILVALNKQINEEFYSAYLYLAMSAAASAQSLDGFANWLMIQAQEERDHAMGFYNHLLERGGNIELTAIASPDYKFVGAMDMLEKSLAHEQHITGCIHNLYKLAEEEKDYAARILLDWYVSEQVEEEDSLRRMIDQLKIAGEKDGGLYLFDQSLGERKYSRASILK
ncbi:MAG TPA: ferritin [bacterium]|nr:ferritin [bacterium]